MGRQRSAVRQCNIRVRLYFEDEATGTVHTVVYGWLTIEDASTLIKTHNRNGGGMWDMFSGGHGDALPPVREVLKHGQGGLVSQIPRLARGATVIPA